MNNKKSKSSGTGIKKESTPKMNAHKVTLRWAYDEPYTVKYRDVDGKVSFWQTKPGLSGTPTSPRQRKSLYLLHRPGCGGTVVTMLKGRTMISWRVSYIWPRLMYTLIFTDYIHINRPMYTLIFTDYIHINWPVVTFSYL